MQEFTFLGGVTLQNIVFTIIFFVPYLVGLWTFFVKSGKPGWWALLPWLNILLILYVLRIRLGWGLWLVVIFFFPLALPIALYYWHLCLARACGYKGVGLALAMLLFFPFTVAFVGLSKRPYDYQGMLLFKQKTKAFWFDVCARFFYRQLAKSPEETRYRYLIRSRKGQL
jgi:hypothetical protein